MDINSFFDGANIVLQFVKWYMIVSSVLLIIVAWFALCIHSRLVDMQQEINSLKEDVKGEKNGECIK